MTRDKVICVAGPTASGKTNLGARLARALDGEVVSCDLMQIYRGLTIATAKPTPEEMLGVPHHMLDVADPGEAYSVARYVTEGGKCVEDILARGRIPVIVGGTGLYMDALVKATGFADSPPTDHRKRLGALYDRYGGERLHRLLADKDRSAAEKIHPNDKKRLIRALEVAFITGETISEHNERDLRLDERYSARYIGLNWRDRSLLYARINARCDEMLKRGLIDELNAVRKALGGTAIQAIGYKELMDDGETPSAEAIENWKRATRRYAKRQLTWFRRNRDMQWFYRDENTDEEIFEKALKSALLFLYDNIV